MRVYPPFIERLDLAPDADERQVRRAYARELKKIDQEADLEGFQALRTCYEAALAWVEERDAGQDADEGVDGGIDARGAGPAAAAAPPPAREEARHGQPQPQPFPHQHPQAAPHPQLPSPEELGAAVFADFHARCKALAARPDPGGSNDAMRTAPWTVALEEALADQRLLNLDARMIFEGRIAALLADGWEPGHHLLLVAANGVFGWSADRRALERLDRPGAILGAALEQRAMFQDQPHQERAEQRNLMALMRAGTQPDNQTVNQYRNALGILLTHFPAMLVIDAPRGAIVAWRELCATVPPEPVYQAPKQSWWRGTFSPVTTTFLIIAVLRIVAASFHQDAPQPAPFTQSAPWRSSGSATQPVPENDPVLGARIAQIRDHIDYKPGEGALPGQQLADIRVTLDADGKVSGMEALVTGANPAFVAAVERAIEASGPFPPGSPSSFVLEFSSENKSTTWKAPAAHPTPLSKALLAHIERHVDYKPRKDAQPGELLARLKVRLDWEGKVFSIERVEVKGDPAFAAAIERAVRRSSPYPPETPRTFAIWYRTTITSRPVKQARMPEAPPQWQPASPSSTPAASAQGKDTIMRDPAQLRLRAPNTPPGGTAHTPAAGPSTTD